MKEIKVLNTKIAAISAPDLKVVVKDFLTSDGKKKIGKINTEFLLRSLRKDEFHDVLSTCDLNVADGKGVLWAAKYLSLPLKAKQFSIFNFQFLINAEAIWQMIYSGASLVFYPKYCKESIPENIPGLEVMYLMLDAAQETGSGVYFFGAEPDVLPKAMNKIQEKYPDLKIAGYHNGYIYKDEEVIKDINKSEAKLLIVAQGSPKQEYWIRDHYNQLKSIRIAVGEGGTLDFVAGSSKRAPKFMQKMGIEWFWRLFLNQNKSVNTGGRAKRVWNAVPVFIYEVVKWKIGNR